jgi:hypothetical protein
MPAAMVKVYTTPDPTDLAHVQGLLQQAGIQTCVMNESTSVATGDIPFQHAAPELWVTNPADAPRAREIIEAYEARREAQPPQQPPWKCPHCGEMIEAQFSECWKCGTAREDNPRTGRDA